MKQMPLPISKLNSSLGEHRSRRSVAGNLTHSASGTERASQADLEDGMSVVSPDEAEHLGKFMLDIVQDFARDAPTAEARDLRKDMRVQELLGLLARYERLEELAESRDT